MADPPHGLLLKIGAKVTRARRRKETTYPELVGRHARARLVVLGVEVGGRFSMETQAISAQAISCSNLSLLSRDWQDLVFSLFQVVF